MCLRGFKDILRSILSWGVKIYPMDRNGARYLHMWDRYGIEYGVDCYSDTKLILDMGGIYRILSKDGDVRPINNIPIGIGSVGISIYVDPYLSNVYIFAPTPGK